jgi:hypothetical protein
MVPRARILAVLVFSILGPGRANEASAQDDFRADFRRIQSLKGEREGPYEWSGARKDSGRMRATYQDTGHGTAVLENLLVDGEPLMTSVYHMDGPSLRMTHYCAAGNQPRLRAERGGEARDTLRFVFVDATNLAGPAAPHVEGLDIRFVDAEHVVLTFHFTGGGARSDERITLTRSPRPGRS